MWCIISVTVSACPHLQSAYLNPEGILQAMNNEISLHRTRNLRQRSHQQACPLKPSCLRITIVYCSDARDKSSQLVHSFRLSSRRGSNPVATCEINDTYRTRFLCFFTVAILDETCNGTFAQRMLWILWSLEMKSVSDNLAVVFNRISTVICVVFNRINTVICVSAKIKKEDYT